MSIGILSQRGPLSSTTRLHEAASERGHDLQVVDDLRRRSSIASRQRSRGRG